MFVKKRKADVVIGRDNTAQSDLCGRSLILPGDGCCMTRERDFIYLLSATVVGPNTQTRPVHGRKQVRIHGYAVRSRLLIRQRQTAEISVRQRAKRGVFEYIITIPFNNRPVKLLSPGA